MNLSLPPASLRVALLLSIAVLAGCSKQADEAAAPAPTTAAAEKVDAQVAQAQERVQGMGEVELRDAASKALAENRIYAPGGDNAVEYYLALRAKAPKDASISSALTDLLPYTVIAAEQALGRERFDEVQRLVGLIEQVDAKAPALSRLKAGVTSGQEAVAKREVDAAKTAEEQAKLAEERRKAAIKVAAEQQASQQQAAQQQAAQQAAAQQQAAEQARQQEAARAAAEREQSAVPAAATPAPAPAPAPVATLRAISTPAPRYPAEALRSGTQGQVVVEITVAPDGSVSNARVVRADPPRVFDREALNAVRRWKFAPMPNPTTVRRTISFSPG